MVDKDKLAEDIFDEAPEVEGVDPKPHKKRERKPKKEPLNKIRRREAPITEEEVRIMMKVPDGEATIGFSPVPTDPPTGVLIVKNMDPRFKPKVYRYTRVVD